MFQDDIKLNIYGFKVENIARPCEEGWSITYETNLRATLNGVDHHVVAHGEKIVFSIRNAICEIFCKDPRMDYGNLKKNIKIVDWNVKTKNTLDKYFRIGKNVNPRFLASVELENEGRCSKFEFESSDICSAFVQALSLGIVTLVSKIQREKTSFVY